ncbi:ABC transporter permease [Paenibacillus sp. JX-17]|uniref:Transport permease protein n=1 Tax=Paenibacillus lacisoli TaxID=3064525 RepID=A0ABT9CFE0_9BACL|nr:ABC transporter permease [Paenibacillus sp. JX-17]MDO7907921.1 ABC transporter permease [Paenibacillus sp. JX-17]
MQNNLALKRLVNAGLKEIIREPKTLFFSIFFPFFFLIMFYGMSSIIDPSASTGLSFIEYLFPGILIFALISIGFLGTSVPIIEMRQKGILKTFRTTPLKESVFVFSQIIVRLILSVLQILFFGLLGLFMGVIELRELIPFILISLLGMGMILTLGFLLGGLFNNTELASGVLSFGMIPLLLLSGAMLPSYILPEFLQYLSYVIPFTYLTDLYHQLLFGFDGKVSAIGDILIVVALCAIFFYLTKRTFRWI